MSTPSVTDAESRADEKLRRALADNATEIERLERQRERKYADRLVLMRAAVDAGWTQARIANACRTSEGAVTQALRRARLADR